MISLKALLSVGGVCVSSGVCGIGFFMFVQHKNPLPSFVYAVSTTTTPTVVVADAAVSESPKEVSCSVEDVAVTDKECSISISTLPTKKKWVDVKELTTSLKDNPTEIELKATNRVFRVQVNWEVFSSLDLTNTTPKKISVKDKNNSSTTITTLKPIFGSYGLTFYHPKLTTFLGEPDWFPRDLWTKQPLTSVLVKPSHDVKCSFINNKLERKDCRINEFSTLSLTKDDDYGAPDKKEFETTAGKLEYHKNYLINLTTPSEALELNKPERRSLYYLRKILSTSQNYFTETMFKTWTPTIFETIGSDKWLFILQ